MSLSNELLYVLPYLSDEDADRVNEEFFKMVGNHQYLFRMAESVGGLPFIPYPSYKSINLENFSLLDEERVIPKESHEFIQVYSDAISPLDSIKSNAKVISKGEDTFNNKQNIHRIIRRVNNFLLQKNSIKSYRVPILSIRFSSEYSLGREHVSTLLRNQRWMRQLIRFFQFITDNNMKANSRIREGSFLFSKEGDLKQFLMFNMLERSNAPSLEILLHNLRVFQTMIQDLSGELYGSGYREDQHNSDFNLLMIAFNKKEYAFDDFNEISAFLDQQGRRGKTPEKVAVFLDTANIFTGLHTYDVDFSNLLSQVFGEKKNITEQYAALFYPEYESESKTRYEKARRDEFKLRLESQGFQVLPASNGEEKAKIVKDGLELDADDLKLIAKMRERMDKYQKVLVLTGDKHFLPIMKEYEEKGIEVHVISIHEDDTSPEIRTHFKDRHHYITDFWESILI